MYIPGNSIGQIRKKGDFMSKPKNPRGYTFSIVTYLTPEKFLSVLSDSTIVNHWFWICHDSDTYEDSHEKAGELKEKHWHICATFTSYRSVSSVCKLFRDIDSETNTFAEIAKDTARLNEYFLHIPNADKFQYDPTNMQYDDVEYWHKKFGHESSDKDEFVDDLISRVLTPVEMARKYGRDYIRNFRNYEYFSQCSYNFENNGFFEDNYQIAKRLSDEYTDLKYQREVKDKQLEERKLKMSEIESQLADILKHEWRNHKD